MPPATSLSLDPSVVTAFVAVLGMVGVISTFVVNALIRSNIQNLLKDMDARYATKQDLQAALVAAKLDEATQRLKHHPAGAPGGD